MRDGGGAGDPTNEINPYAAPAGMIDPGVAKPIDGGGFRSVTPIAQAIAAVMALLALVHILSIANDVATQSAMQRVLSGQHVEHSDLKAIDQRRLVASLASLGLRLAVAVLFCVFMPRANRNARAFGAGPMTFTPGMAAGVFFIPFWNLYKPYRAMKEIWQGSNPDPLAPAFFTKVSALLPWWWGLFLVDNLIRRVSSSAFEKSKGAAKLIEQSQALTLSSLVTIVAATVAAATVRAVARRQDDRQRRHPAGTPALSSPTADVAP